jgi:pimeloyl-ACP methyl ester carboxylesterase
VPEVSSGGVSIHFEIEGEGPPLLLHTGGGGDLEMWRQAGYVDGLPDMRIVLMDHRGHGRSGRPTQLEAHRIDRYVDDVIAVADATGLDRFGFVGYSAGSFVGFAVAARHPSRVEALVGIGAVGGADESMEDGLESAAAARTNGMAALVDRLRTEEPDVPAWFEAQMLSTDPEMFALGLEGWADWAGPWAEFAQITTRTLIVVGELEEGPDGQAATNAQAAAETMPNGRAEVLPALGHVAAFCRSDLVLPLIATHLREVFS